MSSDQKSPKTWQPVGVPDLEPAAWDALRHQGSTAVTAGPGAGKTEFLAQRATYLLQTSLCPQPQRILAISYKRESATNLQRRVSARVPDSAHRFESMTFDAFTKGLVDRFAHSLPTSWRLNGRRYNIGYFKEPEIRVFLEDFGNAQQPHHQAEAMAIQPSRFLPDFVGTMALPKDPTNALHSPHQNAVLQWWWKHYGSALTPVMDHTMLNRLAELIVRSNPQILRGLRATYPFVFVDEFQDTTAAQVTFLRTVFGDPSVVTTVVGDSKQRIMRFAGALEDAIGKYQSDFAARHFALTWNFRSSSDLVAVQHRIATSIDPAAVLTISQSDNEPGHTPLVIWSYPNSEREAAHLADWIEQDIASSSRTTSDFALIARQKIADLAPSLAAAFKKHGLSIRNDDALYGTLKLQDLLKHDVTRCLVGVLSLAASPQGHIETWAETLALLRRMHGSDGSERNERRLSDLLSSLTAQLRKWFHQVEYSAITADEIVAYTASLVGTRNLSGFVKGQNSGETLELILDSLKARLRTAKGEANNWTALCEAIFASDSIALMTVHRSKGLEYHTVIFLGLDDNQWWSYKKDPLEGNSTFFVGLSRAAQRVVFTTTSPRVREGSIKPLLQLLDEAGAQTFHWA